MAIPWGDMATVSVDDAGEGRRTVAEGTLADVIDQLCRYPPEQHWQFLIALPERGAPPYRYGGEHIRPLAAQLHRARQEGEVPPARPSNHKKT